MYDMGADSGRPENRGHIAPTAAFRLLDEGDGIDIRGWAIRSAQRAIAATTVEEELEQQLGIKLPGMLFDKSSLQLQYQSDSGGGETSQPKFELVFNAVDALKMVGEADPSIKVKAAEKWDSKADRDDVEITTIEKASDWTFSSRYPGTVKTSGHSWDDLAPGWAPVSERSASGTDTPSPTGSLTGIDYNALRNTELPILFSSEVILFEDELDDNGTASYRVRIRIMPSFYFILARFFLRVDGVLVRVFDTRYFHRFGTGVVIRESVTREGNLATTLSDVPPSAWRDPDLASQKVPVTSTILENIRLSS